MPDNLSNNSELKIIQEHLNLQSGNILLFSNNSELTTNLSSEKLHVFSSPDQIISDKIDTLLSTNTFQAELSKYDQKFDTIIIHNIFEEIKHPELFLQNLNSVLSDEGTIVCSISNFFYITNIMNLFAGQNPISLFDKTLKYYDLDAVLFLLNKSDSHVIKVNRIKQDFSSNQMNLDETLIPSKLIDIVCTIPDSDTVKYVLMIGKGKTIPSDNLEFVSQFPKNYLLPKLQEFFEKFSELEKSVSDKDKIISGLEDSIKEQKAYTESAIKEQKAYTESALSDKDKLIEGYENSVKEQREYIENLEGHIRNLESELKKFKFWKR